MSALLLAATSGDIKAEIAFFDLLPVRGAEWIAELNALGPMTRLMAIDATLRIMGSPGLDLTTLPEWVQRELLWRRGTLASEGGAPSLAPH